MAKGQVEGGKDSPNFAQLHLVHPQSQLVETERPPGTEHPPRDDLAAHEVQHLNHLVPRSSSRVELLLQLPQRVPAAPFSTGLAWSTLCANAQELQVSTTVEENACDASACGSRRQSVPVMCPYTGRLELVIQCQTLRPKMWPVIPGLKVVTLHK